MISAAFASSWLVNGIKAHQLLGHQIAQARPKMLYILLERESNSAEVWLGHASAHNTSTDRATDWKCITSVTDRHTPVTVIGASLSEPQWLYTALACVRSTIDIMCRRGLPRSE